MKYLSVLVFVVALSWTWVLIHSVPNVGTETHSKIQSAVAQLIRNRILEKNPQASSFLIKKMRTEERNECRGGKEGCELQVHFAYEFSVPGADHNPVQTQIGGQATLERKGKNDQGVEQWTVKKWQIETDAMTFPEGLVVTAGQDDGAADPAPNVTEPPQQ